MIPGSAERLLRKLASGVRPGAARTPARSAFEQTDFRALVDRARAGDLASGRPVELAHDGPATLNNEQREKLAVVADAAAAAGFDSIVISLDETIITLELAERRVTRVDTHAGARLITAPAFVRIPGEMTAQDLQDAFAGRGAGDTEDADGPRVRAPSAPLNSSLARLLAPQPGSDSNAPAGKRVA